MLITSGKRNRRVTLHPRTLPHDSLLKSFVPGVHSTVSLFPSPSFINTIEVIQHHSLSLLSFLFRLPSSSERSGCMPGGGV